MPRARPASLEERLAEVRRRVAAAAARSGRDASAVTIVAVTKTVGVGTILDLARLGQTDFGENRPLDLAEKRREFETSVALDPQLRSLVALRPVRWHMIGHLQRNKVRRVAAGMDLLHSIDSVALAEAVSVERLRTGLGAVPCMLQVNVSGEASKGGFEAAALPAALRHAAALPGLRVTGLMTMAPWSEDPEAARPTFRGLRELRDAAANSGYLSASALSMGMSEDFEVAVEEGASIVRIGRALVGAAPV